MAQSVERQTPGFGSGHDLMVLGFEPPVGLCVGSMKPAWDSLSVPLSLSLSLPHLHAYACTHGLFLSENK